MDDIRSILKLNLKLYRRRKGFTQHQLAEACDVSQSYVGELEIGRKYPSLQMVETLAQVLGVAPWKLLLPEQDREMAVSVLLAGELKESVVKALDDVLRRPRGDQ